MVNRLRHYLCMYIIVNVHAYSYTYLHVHWRSSLCRFTNLYTARLFRPFQALNLASDSVSAIPEESRNDSLRLGRSWQAVVQ